MSIAEFRSVRVASKQIGDVQYDEVDVLIPDSLGILEGNEAPKNHSMFRIINKRDGDKRVVWDRRDLAQIEDARHTFSELCERGLRPYRVDPSGKKMPEIMEEFDPHAEEIIFAPDMTPVLVGG